MNRQIARTHATRCIAVGLLAWEVLLLCFLGRELPAQGLTIDYGAVRVIARDAVGGEQLLSANVWAYVELPYGMIEVPLESIDGGTEWWSARLSALPGTPSEMVELDGVYLVVKAVADGYRATDASYSVVEAANASAESPLTVQLDLHRGSSLAGRVRDGGLRPVQSSLVVAGKREHSTGRWHVPNSVYQYTDGCGYFVIRDAHPADFDGVAAVAGNVGFAYSDMPADGFCDLILSEFETYALGTVRAANGTPLPYKRVGAARNGEEFSDTLLRLSYSFTNAQGRFRVGIPSDGDWLLFPDSAVSTGFNEDVKFAIDNVDHALVVRSRHLMVDLVDSMGRARLMEPFGMLIGQSGECLQPLGLRPRIMPGWPTVDAEPVGMGRWLFEIPLCEPFAVFAEHGSERGIVAGEMLEECKADTYFVRRQVILESRERIPCSFIVVDSTGGALEAGSLEIFSSQTGRLVADVSSESRQQCLQQYPEDDPFMQPHRGPDGSWNISLPLGGYCVVVWPSTKAYDLPATGTLRVDAVMDPVLHLESPGVGGRVRLRSVDSEEFPVLEKCTLLFMQEATSVTSGPWRILGSRMRDGVQIMVWSSGVRGGKPEDHLLLSPGVWSWSCIAPSGDAVLRGSINVVSGTDVSVDWGELEQR